MNGLLKVLAVTSLFWGVAAADDNRIDHFEPQTSETVNEAVENLQTYNRKLAEVLQAERLSAEQLVMVHELTYTLEVALERLHTELGDVADALEEVHQGSERMDEERVRENASRYLEVMERILSPSA